MKLNQLEKNGSFIHTLQSKQDEKEVDCSYFQKQIEFSGVDWIDNLLKDAEMGGQGAVGHSLWHQAVPQAVAYGQLRTPVVSIGVGIGHYYYETR